MTIDDIIDSFNNGELDVEGYFNDYDTFFNILKKRGLMPGLSTANSFISRDENLHAEFAIELYKMLENRLDEITVHSIFREAVEIEKEFITESLPVSLIGMNCKLMTQYIEMVADRWLVLLGYNKIYNTQNPFPFMEMISLKS